MPPNFNELVNSVIRTFAAVFAGAVITFLIAHGFNIDDSLKTPLAGIIFAVASSGYYVVIRFLEHYASEHFGWLLLSAGGPTYPSVTWVDKEDKKVVERARRKPGPHRANLD